MEGGLGPGRGRQSARGPRVRVARTRRSPRVRLGALAKSRNSPPALIPAARSRSGAGEQLLNDPGSDLAYQDLVEHAGFASEFVRFVRTVSSSSWIAVTIRCCVSLPRQGHAKSVEIMPLGAPAVRISRRDGADGPAETAGPLQKLEIPCVEDIPVGEIHVLGRELVRDHAPVEAIGDAPMHPFHRPSTEPRAIALSKPPVWPRTPCRTGSSAAQVALLRNVPADDVRGAAVDGPEEPSPVLSLHPEPRRVRAPKFVRLLGPDPAAVDPVSAGLAPPHRRQQPVLPASASAREAEGTTPGTGREHPLAPDILKGATRCRGTMAATDSPSKIYFQVRPQRGKMRRVQSSTVTGRPLASLSEASLETLRLRSPLK